jgi:probable HAF family extracellular repeat protein
MQRFTTRFALAALVAFVLSTSIPRLAAAGGDRGYTVTDLGTLPGKANSFDWQQSINEGGLIAAYANNSNPADPNAFDGDSSFLCKDGTKTLLARLPNATDTIAFSLNNNGQVVGRSTTDTNHAVLWDHGLISKLGELTGQNSSAALKINDRGQAVGYSRIFGQGTRQAVLWYKGTITQLLPLPGGGNFDEGTSINEKGQIAGFSGPDPGSAHPALWAQGTQGTPVDLGTLGGASGFAWSINNK